MPHRSCFVRAVFLMAAFLAPFAFAQVDRDAPRMRRTSEDVLRWNPVNPKALTCPHKDFRDLARQVAAGSTDSRVLRSYNRLFPRLYPFDRVPAAADILAAAADYDRLKAPRAGAAPPRDWTWVAIGPRNIPGRMTAIALHPTEANTVFTAGADGGIWKTTDLGATWTSLSDFEPTLAMGALAVDAVDPRIMYAGTGEGNYSGDSLGGLGLMKSIDGGSAWTMSAAFAGAFHEIHIDPRNRSRIWAATNNGLFRSDDAGVAFQPAGGGLPASDCTSLVLSVGTPGVLLAGIGTAWGSAPESGLWRSIDNGTSWAQVGSFPSDYPVGRIAVAQCLGTPGRVYAAVHSTETGGCHGVWRSDDEGATWTQVGAPGSPCGGYCWYCLVMAADPVDPNLAYLGGVNLYRTTDGGASWNQINNTGPGSYVHVDQHHLVAPAAGVLWSANDGGINLSRDRGATWTYVGRKLITAQYYHFTTDPTDDTYATGGTQDQGTHRFGGAMDWDVILGADGGVTAIDWTDPRVWYGTWQYLWLQRSRNRGAGMELIAADIDRNDRRGFIAPYILDRSNPSTIYAGTMRVWKSTDQGDTFAAISPELAPGASVLSALDNCRDHPESIWAGTNEGKVWNSPDGGALWNDRSNGLPARSITSIAADPTTAGSAWISTGGTGGGHIWFTQDFGQTWIDRSAGLPDVHFNQVIAIPDAPGELVAAADLGVYFSSDSGQTWVVYGTGLPNVAVDSVSYGPATGTLRVGTHGRGAWQLVAPGACPLTPLFAGLLSADLGDSGGMCVVDLGWNTAVPQCPLTPSIRYNVYRMPVPKTVVDRADLLQSGIAGTTWVDTTAPLGRVSFYAVRAEDGQTGMGGPSNDGKEDANVKLLWATPGSPCVSGDFFDDGGDTTAFLSPGQWSVADCANATPGGRYSYHAAPSDIRFYLPDSCISVATPDVVPGAGAVLSYWASYETEDGWDGVIVEISDDAGASWADLPPDAGYPGTLWQTMGNACGYPPTQGAFTGGPAASVFTSDLAAYAGRAIRVRWRLTSDGGLEYEGFDLDDVRISPAATLPAPAMGNVLLGVKESLQPRFFWTDVAGATSYRLYHALNEDMTDRAAAGSASNGAGGFLDTAPRPEPVHYYRVHAVENCTSEGP